MAGRGADRRGDMITAGCRRHPDEDRVPSEFHVQATTPRTVASSRIAGDLPCSPYGGRVAFASASAEVRLWLRRLTPWPDDRPRERGRLRAGWSQIRTSLTFPRAEADITMAARRPAADRLDLNRLGGIERQHRARRGKNPCSTSMAVWQRKTWGRARRCRASHRPQQDRSSALIWTGRTQTVILAGYPGQGSRRFRCRRARASAPRCEQWFERGGGFGLGAGVFGWRIRL